MKIKFDFWLVVAVISFIIGVGVRFYYGLNTDLWGDEALSYFIAKDTPWLDLIFSIGKYWDLAHPPLYYVFLKTVLLFGNYDWLLRLASLVWFVPSAFLIYLIGHQINDRKSGLLAFSLFSLHPLLNNLAFQARSYAMALFFILLGLHLLLQNLSNPSKSRGWLVGLILAIAFYTDYASAWLMTGIAVFGITTWLKNQYILWEKIVTIFLYFMVFAGYQLAVLVSFIFSHRGRTIVGSVRENNLSWFFEQLNSMTGLQVSLVSLLAISFSSAFILKRKNNNNLLLLITLFCSLVFSSLYSVFFQPIFLARNLIIISIVFIISLSQLNSNIRNLFVIILILFAYGNQSINGTNFLYIKGLEKVVQSKITDKKILVSFIEYPHYLKYYLYETRKTNVENSLPVIIQHNNIREIDGLSSEIGEEVVLLYDYRISIPSSDIRIKSQAVKSKVCNNNFCEEFFF